MLSLRNRLTLSYAVLVGSVLGVVVLFLTRFAFEVIAAPTNDATQAAFLAAKLAVANARGRSPEEIEALVVSAARRPRVDVRVLRPAPGPGSLGRVGGPGVPPGPEGAPRFDSRNGGFISAPHGRPFLDPSKLLGLTRHVLPVGRDLVFISPEFSAIDDAISRYLGTLAIGVTLALVLSWLIARWITAQAIRPLITVTSELRRFADGDFTATHLTTKDRDELGALIAAYNGAVAKVADAFDERRRVEEHMRRFVADAGHELRTPLTVVSGYLQILRKADPNDRGVRDRALATLETQSARMRALVERLMALARLERADPVVPTTIDVVAIARDAIDAAVAARGGDVTLTVREPATVLADAGDLHEAIGNLVENAVKYGAAPVTVEVRANEGEIVVSVRDAGPGIPENERAHVFERFFRGSSGLDIQGSGLGLAIVERAVTRVRGTVTLVSASPGNTCFEIRLPEAPHRAERPREPVAL